MYMDAIYPYCNNSYWQENELRYSLRSLKHFKDLGRVFIVGEKPKWIKNIIHIPYKDKYPNNKGANIISKIIIACKDKRISDDFLFMADDNYFLKPIKATQIKNYYNYDLSNFMFTGSNKIWMKCLKNTRKILMKEKRSCYAYETHTPYIINKRKFQSVMHNYDWKNILYPTFSLYFNNTENNPQQIPDNYRAFYGRENMKIDLKGKTFLAFSDLGLSSQLQKELKRRFPRKSKFEQ